MVFPSPGDFTRPGLSTAAYRRGQVKAPRRARRWLLKIDRKSIERKKSETRKLEKKEKTRKRHPDILYDFVLCEISCFRVFFFAQNRFIPCGVLRSILDFRIEYNLVFAELKSSPKDEGSSPNP